MTAKLYTVELPPQMKISCPFCSSKTKFTRNGFKRHIWNRKQDHFSDNCDSVIRQLRTSNTEWHCPFYDCRLAHGSSKLAVFGSFEAVYHHVIRHMKSLFQLEDCLLVDGESGDVEIGCMDETVGQRITSSRMLPMNPPFIPAILEDDHYNIADPNPMTPFMWYQYYHSDWYDTFTLIQQTCFTANIRNQVEVAASQKHTRDHIDFIMDSQPFVKRVDMEEDSSSSSSSSGPSSTRHPHRRVKVIEDKTTKVYLDSKNNLSAHFKMERVPSFVVPPL